jgi:hypothetical protein
MERMTDQEVVNVMRGIIQQRRAEGTPAELHNAEMIEALVDRLAYHIKIMDEVKMWKRDCIDFTEKQRCPVCGHNVGMMIPLGAAMRIKEAEEEIESLTKWCRELEKEVAPYDSRLR